MPLNTKRYQVILTQYHKEPISTAPYWPSTIIYQPVPLRTDPLPPSINHYRPILTHYHQVSAITAPYQPILPSTDLVPPSINQYCPILAQYHQVPKSTALNWPSTTKYQTVLTQTYPLPSIPIFPYWPTAIWSYHLIMSTIPDQPQLTRKEEEKKKFVFCIVDPLSYFLN